MLANRYLAASFDKQLYLANLIGEADWHLDMAAGLLSFGDRHRWHVQLLGTEANESQTWLWAWANEASGIPTQLLGSALTLRMLGEAQGIPELAEAEVPLNEVNGHVLAMIGSGVCRADAYYRCPYEGGAAFASCAKTLAHASGVLSTRSDPRDDRSLSRSVTDRRAHESASPSRPEPERRIRGAGTRRDDALALVGAPGERG
jgi:hypothetical protein